jgi:heme/flavin dehydrogenase (mycofactocin system)
VGNPWFETVAVAKARSKKRLPRSVYGAIVAGAEAGISRDDNLNAFDELGIRPVAAGQHAHREMATTIMGQPASMPVMISPTGVQAVHPEGEIAVARATAARGVPMGLSSFGSKPLEDVIEANPQTFFQIYWAGDRDSMSARMQRARDAGVAGMILTLDWSFSHGRDWGSPSIPERLDLKTAIEHAPDVLTRPQWLMSWLKTGRLPDFGVPNFPTGGAPVPGFFEAYGTWMSTPPPTWDEVADLIEEWGGEFMVKGIGRPDEAKRAVQAGATAISVSNHGGNNIDSSPAPIRVLPEIVAAVGSEIQVIMDGGIRRGSDVVKALAFGAEAVLIGRAYLWGLAANGQAGVENVFDILRSGMDATLLGMGKSGIADLSQDDISVPRDFFPPHI